MAYIPERGDIITLDFDPQTGHEQKGKRPAIVISNSTFNNFTRMAMVCPITNTSRGFPLHVALDTVHAAVKMVSLQALAVGLFLKEAAAAAAPRLSWAACLQVAAHLLTGSSAVPMPRMPGCRVAAAAGT